MAKLSGSMTGYKKAKNGIKKLRKMGITLKQHEKDCEFCNHFSPQEVLNKRRVSERKDNLYVSPTADNSPQTTSTGDGEVRPRYSRSITGGSPADNIPSKITNNSGQENSSKPLVEDSSVSQPAHIFQNSIAKIKEEIEPTLKEIKELENKWLKKVKLLDRSLDTYEVTKTHEVANRIRTLHEIVDPKVAQLTLLENLSKQVQDKIDKWKRQGKDRLSFAEENIHGMVLREDEFLELMQELKQEMEKI